MKKTIFVNVLITLLALLSACGGSPSDTTDNVIPTQERGNLISATFIPNTQSFLLPYTVNSYKIVYYTLGTNDSIIKASGLLSIPVKSASAKSPLLSYQHGTIFLDSRAPSEQTSSIACSLNRTFCYPMIRDIAMLSGNGYIVSSPDFIGYGESTQVIHPYIHRESLASASIDMLKASQKYLTNNNIATNNQLFLVGYSEGGYATMAMQKELQENYNSEYSVTASAPGAGPFDLSVTAKILANKVTNENPSYISFVIKAYDETYGLEKIDMMYQAPYRNIINTYFDSNHSSDEIDAALSHTTSELFEPVFLSLLQGNGAHVLKDKLAENNIYDWKPTAPIRLYHGPLDEVVPYVNASKAYETMEANGAADVSLGICPLDTHVLCAGTYIFDTLNFFSSRADDL